MVPADIAASLARGEQVLDRFPAHERPFLASVWELHAWSIDLELSARVLRRPVGAVSEALGRIQTAVAGTLSAALLSIGYQGRDVPDLVTTLVNHEVSTVIDVRLNAVSRKRGFSKRALSAALGEAGIKYLHERDLGNPKDNRAPFHDGDLDAGRARFFELLESAHAAVDRVISMLAGQRVALLCFESDHKQCHRWCIAERATALKPDLAVLHL